MALEVKALRDARENVNMLTADRRLWLTADNETIVEEGDPKAAFLLCGAGQVIPERDAERFGLSSDADGHVVQRRGEQAVTKQQTAHEDKAAPPPTTKKATKKAKR